MTAAVLKLLLPRALISTGALLLLCACRSEIVHDLSEQQASRLLAELQEASINAQKLRQADGAWALAVKQPEAMRALKFLADRRRLRGPRPAQHSSSLLSSREEQRYRHERMLSSGIEQTLMTLDGVLEARVHLNLPPVDPVFGSRPEVGWKASASAMLIVGAEFAFPGERVGGLIAGATGIPIADVAVLITRNGAAGSTAPAVVTVPDARPPPLSAVSVLMTFCAGCTVIAIVRQYRQRRRLKTLGRHLRSEVVSASNGTNPELGA